MNEYVVAEEHRKGLTIKVYPDDAGANDPREWDQLGTMLCWHPDYKLGDEQFSGPDDVGGSRSMQDVARWLFRERKATVLLPLYLYDHSGISMRAGGPIYRQSPKDEAVRSSGRFMGDDAGWDTSMVGFIYTTKERIAELGAPADSIVRQLKGEIDEYDDFLTGNVYGYVIEDGEGEVIDSCWGFFPDHDAKGMPWDGCLEEARSVVDGLPQVIRREQAGMLVGAGAGL